MASLIDHPEVKTHENPLQRASRTLDGAWARPRSRAGTGSSTEDDELALVAARGRYGVASGNPVTTHKQAVSGTSASPPAGVAVATTSTEGLSAEDKSAINLATKVQIFAAPMDQGGWKTAYIRGPKCCESWTPGTKFLRYKVTKKKRRFLQDGFDLDLTYVTDRVIAMGFPSAGLESLYRNPRSQMQRFFQTRHPGHHRVYNLCSEPGRGYPKDCFHSVVRVPFPDHGVPALPLMYWACEDMATYLSSDPLNVVAIHCKAGKGRSGLFVCMLLLRLGLFNTPQAAIAFYNEVRTKDGNGVRVPSQVRYTGYYHSLLQQASGDPERVMRQPALELNRIVLHCAGTEARTLRLTVTSGAKYRTRVLRIVGQHSEFRCNNVSIRGNFHIAFHTVGCRSKKLIAFWLNTTFVNHSKEEVPKLAIDSLLKDTKHKKFPEDFAVHVYFGDSAKKQVLDSASQFRSSNLPRRRGASEASVASTATARYSGESD